jgi:hypothetical protein
MWVGEIVIIPKARYFAWHSKLRGISPKIRMLNGPETREYVNVHEEWAPRGLPVLQTPHFGKKWGHFW